MTDPTQAPSKEIVPGPQDPRPSGCRCGDMPNPRCPVHPNGWPQKLSQRDLYKPENVVAYLRSIESSSIAGMQYKHAADEIERLRGQLDAAEQHIKILLEQRAAHEPPADGVAVAVSRLSRAMGDPTVGWQKGGSCEAAVINEATRRLTLPPAPEPLEDGPSPQAALQDALRRLSQAMGNPAVAWDDRSCIEAAVVDEAVRRLSQPPSPEQWVSVDNRLPELEAKVLYAFNGYTWLGRYKGLNDGLPCFAGPAGFVSGDATHWMACPEPPASRPTKGEGRK